MVTQPNMAHLLLRVVPVILSTITCQSGAIIDQVPYITLICKKVVLIISTPFFQRGTSFVSDHFASLGNYATTCQNVFKFME